MKYSIVINSLTKTEEKLDILEKTFASIFQSIKDRDDVEVILVDDGSTMDISHLKDMCDQVIEHSPNKGIAPSWNAGKNVAKGEYVVIINDDILVPVGWLDILAEGFKLFDHAGVVGVLKAGPDVGPALMSYMGYVTDRVFFPGFCFMFKKDRWFEDFDEQFVPFNFEDTDMWHRIEESGLTLIKAPIAIWHAEGKTIHSMEYDERSKINLQKFIDKHGYNPQSKYYNG